MPLHEAIARSPTALVRKPSRSRTLRLEDEVWSTPRLPKFVIAVIQAGHTMHIEHSDGYYPNGQASMLDVLDRCRQHAQGFMIGMMDRRDFLGGVPFVFETDGCGL